LNVILPIANFLKCNFWCSIAAHCCWHVVCLY